ncbi:MAG: hypothetical protein FWF59_15785 [Turicibacter sp.]|nr:hypothetical protein [Turicibacter sp.]
MPNLLKRIYKAVKAEIDQTLEEKDIKPGELLSEFLKNCEIEVAKIEALIKRQDVINTRFHKERDEALSKGKKRRRQAEVAAKAGEEELQKRANDEALYYEGLAAELDVKCQKAQADLEKLRENLNEMKKKIKEVNLEQLEQISKDNIALISKRLKEAYDRFTTSQSPAQEPEQDVQVKELPAPEDDLDAQIAALEQQEATDET